MSHLQKMEFSKFSPVRKSQAGIPKRRNKQPAARGKMVVVMLTDGHAALAFFSLLALTAVLTVCMICRKRRTEGTYRPSAEEHKQSWSPEAEKPGLTLPLPKEERLI